MKNWFIILLIIILSVAGFITIAYITNRSTSDCTQKDGKADHVREYKYDSGLHTCVPDICEDGYGPIQDDKCFDCSTKNGTDNVKTYVYDKTQNKCIISECKPGFKGDDCQTPTCIIGDLNVCTCDHKLSGTWPQTYTLCQKDGSGVSPCGVLGYDDDGAFITACDWYCPTDHPGGCPF